MPGIIWLASYPKSGNTWTRFLIANYLLNPEEPVPINDIPHLNFISHDSPINHFERFAGKKLEEMEDEEVAAVRGKVHQWLAMSRGRDIFVKTHNLCGIAFGFPLIAPEATAGAIYIVRNPLDVVPSFAHHFSMTIDRAVEVLCTPEYYLPHAKNQIRQHLGSWTQHVNSWMKAPGMQRYVMRYEDLHRDPINTVGGLMKFLGLPPDRQRLEKAIRFSSFDQLQSQEAKEKFKEAREEEGSKFFRSGKTGGWQDVLSDQQVQTIIENHKDTMKRFGYLDEESKPAVS